MLKKTTITKTTLLVIGLCFMASPAFAAGAGGSTPMPWESGIQLIADSLKGPVAYGVAIIGFIIAGIGFVIQGEMTGWAKKMIQIVMGLSVLLSVVALISAFFGLSAATIM